MGVQSLTDLTGNQGLTAARRSVQQHTTDVLNTHLAEDLRRKHTGGEGTTEDISEFLIQTSDTHGLEVESALEQTAVATAGTSLNTEESVLLLLEEQGTGLDELTASATDGERLLLTLQLNELHTRDLQAQRDVLQLDHHLFIRFDWIRLK